MVTTSGSGDNFAVNGSAHVVCAATCRRPTRRAAKRLPGEPLPEFESSSSGPAEAPVRFRRAATKVIAACARRVRLIGSPSLSTAESGGSVTTRDEQREATRRRIIDVAVESLVERGFAATTTVEVQRRAGLSRGALLHHFRTREELFTAAVHRLVEVNLDAMRRELAAAPDDEDPVTRGVWILRRASRCPSFAAELELWGAARTDAQLRSALLAAERQALHDLRAVIDAVFGPRIMAATGYPVVVELTIQLMRGVTISSTLLEHAKRNEPLIDAWARAARILLTTGFHE
jgi:AcrR family transcriptional regulator